MNGDCAHKTMATNITMQFVHTKLQKRGKKNGTVGGIFFFFSKMRFLGNLNETLNETLFCEVNPRLGFKDWPYPLQSIV